jgi:hypothetical protein
LINYKYEADEVWTVWPPDVSMKSFGLLVPSIVNQIIRVSLCDPIRNYIKEAKDEVVNSLQDFQTALKDLKDGLQSYNATINGDVPRYY